MGEEKSRHRSLVQWKRITEEIHLFAVESSKKATTKGESWFIINELRSSYRCLGRWWWMVMLMIIMPAMKHVFTILKELLLFTLTHPLYVQLDIHFFWAGSATHHPLPHHFHLRFGLLSMIEVFKRVVCHSPIHCKVARGTDRMRVPEG